MQKCKRNMNTNTYTTLQDNAKRFLKAHSKPTVQSITHAPHQYHIALKLCTKIQGLIDTGNHR